MTLYRSFIFALLMGASTLHASDCVMALYLRALFDYTMRPEFEGEHRMTRVARYPGLDGSVFAIQNLDRVSEWAISNTGQVLFGSDTDHSPLGALQTYPRHQPGAYFLYNTTQLEALDHVPAIRRSTEGLGKSRLCSSTVFNSPACSPQGTAYAYPEMVMNSVPGGESRPEHFVVVLDLVQRKIKRRFSVKPILSHLASESGSLFSRRDLTFSPPISEPYFSQRKLQVLFLDEETLLVRIPLGSFDVIAKYNFVYDHILDHWMTRVSDPAHVAHFSAHSNWIFDDELLLIPDVGWTAFPPNAQVLPMGFYATLINTGNGRTQEYFFPERPIQILLHGESHRIVALYEDRIEVLDHLSQKTVRTIASKTPHMFHARIDSEGWLAYYGNNADGARVTGVINLETEIQEQFVLPGAPENASTGGFYLRPTSSPEWELIEFVNYPDVVPNRLTSTIRRWDFSIHGFKPADEYPGFPFGIRSIDFGTFDPTLAIHTMDDRLFVLKDPTDDNDRGTQGTRPVDSPVFPELDGINIQSTNLRGKPVELQGTGGGQARDRSFDRRFPDDRFPF